MPEGDSVHRLRARMAPLEGRLITHAELRVPKLATETLAGMRIDAVEAWGKNLFWHMSADDRERLVLHTHLKMEGNWVIQAAEGAPEAPFTTRVLIRVEGSPDPAKEVELQGRELGEVNLWFEWEHETRTAHLGPDPLADDWDTVGRWDQPGRDVAIQHFRAARSRPLAETLLDQSVLAGVGNEYANELCHLLGRHPHAPAGSVNPVRAMDLAASTMRENLPRSNRMFTGIDLPGQRSFVYGRNGRPCGRCGTRVETTTTRVARSVTDPHVDQQRILYFCPRCQPIAL